MADKAKVVLMVIRFIKENELYSFKSLTEVTQQKLIDVYGVDIASAVDIKLGII